LDALEVTATEVQTTVQKELETEKVLLMMKRCPMPLEVLQSEAIAAGAP